MYKNLPRFAVEAHQKKGPNVARLQLVTGGRLRYMADCYLVPHNTSTLDRVIAVIGQQP